MKKKTNLSPRETLTNQFHKSIHSIFVLAGFTLINLILIVAKADIYFLFTAYVPYFIAYMGAFLCGMLPPETYGEGYTLMQFLPGSIFAVALIIALVILAFYVLCAFMGRKGKIGWLITALVFFSFDTILTIFLSRTFIDMAFHIGILISIIFGVVALNKLKKLPPDEIVVDEVVVEDEESTEELEAAPVDNE